jgi:hypothetical protein
MADEAPSGHYKDFPSRLARKCMTTRERLDRDRRRNFLIAFTGFGMSIVAVVAGLIRPEFTREFVVVFLSDWPFSADHSPTLCSAGDVFTVSSRSENG